MHTATARPQRFGPDVSVSEFVLSACVHCGFCNATCPTYQLTGNELEGPRGRIYLIKSVLEDQAELAAPVVSHLDHCLSCLACETTCPSGVRYSHLIDAARHWIEQHHRRPLGERLQRKLLARLLPYPGRFRLALRLGQLGRPLARWLPGRLGAMARLTPARLPPRSRLDRPGVHPAQGARRMRVALLTGCAQRVVGPAINDATIRLLTRLGAEVVLPEGVGCCGALVFHMGNHADSLGHMRANIERWDAERAAGGLDAIVINTSGCGSVVRDYGHIFRDDPAWADKAARVAALARDVSEVVAGLGLPQVAAPPAPGLPVAYHDACSLQHGQRVRDEPRRLLRAAGFAVVDIPDGHLCCGSAGTYNMLQPHMAEPLGRRKAEAIAGLGARAVAAGNIGCLEQIARFGDLPTVHTVELLDWATGGPRPAGLPAGHAVGAREG